LVPKGEEQIGKKSLGKPWGKRIPTSVLAIQAVPYREGGERKKKAPTA